MGTDFDYNALGLKCGIEIHQQLESQQKLFCRCPNRLEGTRQPDYTILRMHRPVLGETGQFDEAMVHEFRKGMSVIYEGYYDSTCTYEIDETPPFLPNEECIDIALEIALLFKMKIVRELHIARKNYVDGSVPGGFQRTMAFGKDGELLLKSGKTIRMENLFLEEDAARKIKTEGKVVTFRIDRLGIPLVEITTAPDIFTPDEARDAAYRIGLLLRSTGKVKKVLGSIRQDLNISIKDGARIEIKGVQRLDSIPEWVKLEVQRQIRLLEIKRTLLEMHLSPDNIQKNPQDITDILKDTPCKFIAANIKKGDIVWGMKIPGFKGIFGTELVPNRRFGTEVAGKVRVTTDLKGLIHSDEDLLGKYNFKPEEIAAVKKKLQVADADLFVMISGPKTMVDLAFDIVVERSKYAFMGVPQETRQAQEDGTSEFLRELHGGSRLYPDTDSIAYPISPSHIEKVRKILGLYPWEMIEQYSGKYKLEKDAIESLIMAGNIKLFDKLIAILPDNPTLIVTTLNDTLKVLHREEKDIDNLDDQHFITLFKALKEGKIGKEAIISILRNWTENPKQSFEQAKEKAGIASFNLADLDKIIAEIIQKNVDMIKQKARGAMGPLMGDLQKVVGRGTVDGKILATKLTQAIDDVLGGGKVKKESNATPKDLKEPKEPVGKKSTKKSGGKQ